MLFNGERVGEGRGPKVDVAVDPLEGTRLCAFGQAECDCRDRRRRTRARCSSRAPRCNMEKIAVGANARTRSTSPLRRPRT